MSESRARLLRSSGLHRVIRLFGRVTATVEYDSRRVGLEQIRLNGELVRQESSFGGYHSRFEFQIPTPEGRVQARIQVRVSLWAGVTGFCLTVAGETLYADGAFGEVGESAETLPIPARAPRTGASALPRAARFTLLELQPLPLPFPLLDASSSEE